MNFTSIEESKMLVELGIDPNTSDLWYSLDDEDPEYAVVNIEEPPFEWEEITVYDRALPCWSTGALIDLLPVEIEGFDFKKNGQYWSLSILEYFSYNDVYFKVKYGKGEIAFEEHKLIDALIDMIEWLKENKYM